MKSVLQIFFGILVNLYAKAQVISLDDTPDLLSEKQFRMISKLIKPFPNNTEISVALIENGETNLFGVKKINDKITLVENDLKIFEIGSITKVFTASLLSRLVLEGKVSLTDRVQKFLPAEISFPSRITFEHLANHTSGLPRMPLNFDIENPDFHNSWKEYGEQKLIEYLKSEITLHHTPGKKWEYSNLGSGLLGFVLEGVSNSTYEELLQEFIFKKYDMAFSGSILNSLNGEIVSGLDKSGKETPNWEFDVLVGAGGIFSTAKDMSNFALAQFDKRNHELGFTQKPTFEINKRMKIGLGWYLLKMNKSSELLWHNGGTSGYTSSMALDLENQNGVIILSNVSAFHKKMGNVDQLCLSLIKTLKTRTNSKN